MVRLPSGILDGRQYILTLQVRVVLEYLIESGACTQQVQDVTHANSHTSNARAFPTLRDVDRYAAEVVCHSRRTLKTSVDEGGWIGRPGGMTALRYQEAIRR